MSGAERRRDEDGTEKYGRSVGVRIVEQGLSINCMQKMRGGGKDGRPLHPWWKEGFIVRRDKRKEERRKGRGRGMAQRNTSIECSGRGKEERREEWMI